MEQWGYSRAIPQSQQGYASNSFPPQQGTGAPAVNPVGGVSAVGASVGAPLQYGGAYASVYGSLGQSNPQQAYSSNGARVSGQPSAGNVSAPHGLDSSKYMTNDYNSSSAHMSADRPQQYGQNQSSYFSRDIHTDATRRYTDNVGHARQALPVQQLQTVNAIRQGAHATSLDVGGRGADYLSSRETTMPAPQDYVAPLRDILGSSYGSRLETDASLLGRRAVTMHEGPGGRNLDDRVYGQVSPHAGYGVSLPPGRDYSSGKGSAGGSSFDTPYGSSLGSRVDHLSVGPSRFDSHDDRTLFRHEIERRQEGLLREREKEREWELELFERREREREKEMAREREREREKARERERERERERQREREREREREKERERRQRQRELRRRPLAPIRYRKEPSTPRRDRSIKRDSPHREPLHRHFSSPRDRKNEYACKIASYRVVEIERDCNSVNRRYPRLFVSPDFSKLVVHWVKKGVQLPLNVPISFEHDAVLEESNQKVSSSKSSDQAGALMKTSSRSTLWKSKVILMSGISESAMAELLSEKRHEGKVLNFHNALKFAVIRKDHTFLLAGGFWDEALDAGDPASDDSALIHTAIRCFKEATQLDLSICKRWYRFLEVEYERLGNDGVPTHKEVTVIFVPDLSTCLPSLETWKTQYLEHRRLKLDRECQDAERKEKKEDLCGKDASKDTVSLQTDKDSEIVEESKKEKDNKQCKMKSSGKKAEKETKKKPEAIHSEKNGTDEIKTEQKGDMKIADQKQAGKKKNVKKDAGSKKEENSADSKIVEGKKTQKKIIQNSDEEGKVDKKKAEVKKIDRKDADKKSEKSKLNDEEKITTVLDGKTDEDDGIKSEKRSENIERDSKDAESKLKVHKSKGKREEACLDHPGFVLTTKSTKHGKMTSLTLSLDALLDYSEKERDEATFELSLFAETFQEMLQYQMGSRILESLEALRQAVTLKRANRKRPQNEEEKEAHKGSSPKRSKSCDSKSAENAGKHEGSDSKPITNVEGQKVVEKDEIQTGCTVSKEEKNTKVEKGAENIQVKGENEAVAAANKTDTVMEEKVDGNNDEEDVAEEEEREPQEGEEEEEEEEEEVEEEEEEEEMEEEEEDPEEYEEEEPEEFEEEEPEEQEENEEHEKQDSGEKEENTEDEKTKTGQKVAEDQGKDTKVDKSERARNGNVKDAGAAKDVDVEMEDVSKTNEGTSKEKEKEDDAQKNKQKEEEKSEASSRHDRKKSTVMDNELLKAYRFFDRNNCGYIKADDLKRLLHSLGMFLSSQNVKELVSCALYASNDKPRDERIIYANLCKKR